MNRKMRANLTNKIARTQKEHKLRRKQDENCGRCGEESETLVIALVVSDAPHDKKTLH